MTNAAIATQELQLQAKQTPLPLRDDTILGVCEALGQDFGFNPLWLRIALAAGLLWNPTAIVAIYLGLGVVVAASRLVFPAARKAGAAKPAPVQAEAPAVEAEVEQEERELIAA
jgi:phage shock protein C